MRRVLTTALLVGFATISAHAYEVGMPRERLPEAATHVVVGTVKTVYGRLVDEGPWRMGNYVAEVVVVRVEKGEGIASDAPLYVRYRGVVAYRGRGPVPIGSPLTHHDTPKEGETLRFYLARNAGSQLGYPNTDGGFNVLRPNGFERLETPARK